MESTWSRRSIRFSECRFGLWLNTRFESVLRRQSETPAPSPCVDNVFGTVASRESTRALDVEFERTVLGVDDIVWTFKIAQTQVRGVRVVREVQGQSYVISVLLSCVW